MYLLSIQALSRALLHARKYLANLVSQQKGETLLVIRKTSFFSLAAYLVKIRVGDQFPVDILLFSMLVALLA